MLRIISFETFLALPVIVQVKDSWDMDSAQKLAEAAKKKEQGNSLFKSGNMFHAARKYEKVVYNVFYG